MPLLVIEIKLNFTGLAAASTARPALLDTTSSQTLTGGTLIATEVQMDTTKHAV